MSTPRNTVFNLAHLDAAENVFFQRELEQISLEQLDIRYAPLKALSIVPVYTAIDPGAETWTYTQYEKLGKAQPITSFSDDFAKVNVKGTQASQAMKSYGAGFDYSIQELRAAAKAGRPLERQRAETARDVINSRLDEIAAIGDSDNGLKGILNLSGTSTATAVTKGAGGTGWLDAGNNLVATPDEVYKDLDALATKVFVDTLETERPNRIVLPTAHFTAIQNTRASPFSEKSVLGSWLERHPGVEISSWSRCATAGAGSGTRAMSFEPRIENVRLLLPIAFEMQAPQQVNMAYKVNCHMRAGGVVSPYPKTVTYMDGI